MAKRKQIIKLLDLALEKEKEELTENSQVSVYNFHMGVLFGLNLAKVMIQNKREKEHDF